MADNIEIEVPASLRAVVAVGVTMFIGYLVFLVLDIAHGWGLGWIVLGWIGLGVGGVFAVVCLLSVWMWVYRGTGRYQMSQRK